MESRRVRHGEGYRSLLAVCHCPVLLKLLCQNINAPHQRHTAIMTGGQLSFKSSSSLFIFKYRFFQYLCYKARKCHEVTTNLPASLSFVDTEVSRNETSMMHDNMWPVASSSCSSCVRVWAQPEAARCVFEGWRQILSQGRGCGDNHFWTSLFAQLATPFYRNSLACQRCKLLSACPQTTYWCDDVKHNAGLNKKAKTTSGEKQEAEFVAKVYRGDIHVAVVARASKTRWVWCGFTEIHHHEILHCGFMVCL